MTLKKITKTLKTTLPLLKKNYNVKEIGIFGSYCRGNESKKSDIDILVEFNGPIGWEFIDIKEYLEQIFRKKVDLVTVRALKPQLRDSILKEVIYI